MEGGEHDPEGPLSWNYYFPHKSNENITPFAMTGNPQKSSWAVRSYATPHVTVVIPCGPGHDKFLPDALDSVMGQTYQNVECIVCNDTGGPLDVAAMGHPWVKVVEGRQEGPGAARNDAIKAAVTPFIVPLDADDMLYPDTIRTMYTAWNQWPQDIVYMDCDIEDSPDKRKYYHSGPWSWKKISRQEAVYQVTIFYPKKWWETVGGYPEDMGWEDWLFGVKLHIGGAGATRVEQPWGVYRHWTGFGQAGKDAEGFGTPAFKEKMQHYYEWIEEQEVIMGCKGCGGRAGSRTVGALPETQRAETIEGDAIIVYKGPRGGGFSLNSRAVRGKKYMVYPNEPFEIHTD